MSILSSLATSDEIAADRDVLGQSGPVETGLYPSEITLAYLGKSKGGAMSLTVHLKTDTGREVRNTVWMTSGDDKGNLNYYVDKDGAKSYLPGFNLANALCLLTVGKEISQLEPEEKVVKLYNFEQKAEVPTKVQVLTDLLGKRIIAGIFKQIVDKNVQDASGKYVPSGETREENEIDKFYREKDRKTVAEIRAQAEEATFIDAWAEKWAGKTRNRSKGAAAGGTAGLPNGGGVSVATGKPTSSLFS